MANGRQNIIIGNQSNDGTGDSIRDAFRKVNENFSDIYNYLGIGNGFSFLKLNEAPSSLKASNSGSKYATLLGINEFGTKILNKTISAGTGISLTLYDDQIIINNTVSNLSAQSRPTLGGDLDARSLYNLVNIRTTPPATDYEAVSRKWVYETFVSKDGTFIRTSPDGTDYTGTSYISGAIKFEPYVQFTSSTNVVSKAYADTKLGRAGIDTYDPEIGAVNPILGTMTGALHLFRDPVEGDHPYTAATKSYVDSSGFVSVANFYVALSGNDNRIDIPSYKKGRGWNYAFKTINRAAQAAEKVLEASQITVGVYQKTISVNNNQEFATVVSVDPSPVIQSKLHGVRIAIDVPDEKGSDPYINGSIFPGAYVLGARTGAIGRLEKITIIQSGNGYQELYDITPVDYGLSFDTQLRVLPNSINTGTVVFRSEATNMVPFPDFWVGYKFTETDNNGNIIAQGVITGVDYDYDSSGSVHDVVKVDFSESASANNIPLPLGTEYIDDGFNTTATWHVYAPDYIVTETLIWGQRQVKEQISIMVESGEHEEQYPVKIGENVSIRGDEFRRSVIKPIKLYGSQLSSISGSKWANLKFHRDTQTDGIITVQLDRTKDYASTLTSYLKATPDSETPNGVTGLIIFKVTNAANASVTVPGDWIGKVFYQVDGDVYNQGVIRAVVGDTFSVLIAENSQFERKITTTAGVAIENNSSDTLWSVYAPINYGFHYLRDASRPVNVLTTLTNSGGFLNAAKLLEENKEFIQDEIVHWFDETYYQFQTTWDLSLQEKCARDTGLIVDAVAQDILSNDVSQTTFAGIQYWNQNGYTGLISSEITTTTQTLSYLRGVCSEIVSNTIGNRYQSNIEQFRDPLNAASSVGTLITNNFDKIISILQNTNNLVLPTITDQIVPNTISSSTTITYLGMAYQVWNAYKLLQKNRLYIQEEAIAYIEQVQKATNPTFSYNTATCKRDVGYIVDSISFDILYGQFDGNGNYTNRQSIQSGVYYYNYVNETVIPNELPETLGAYNYLKSLLPKIVQGYTITSTYQTSISQTISGNTGTYAAAVLAQGKVDNLLNIIENGPDVVTTKTPISLTRSNVTGVINAANMLNNNRAFLKAEIVAYVNNQFSFNINSYNQSKSRRDAGSIVGGLIEDLKVGGWWRTVNNGDSIVNYVTNLTTACVATIRQIGVIASNVLENSVYPTSRGFYDIVGTYTNLTPYLTISNDIAANVGRGWTVVDSMLPRGFARIVDTDYSALITTSTNKLTLDFLTRGVEYMDINPWYTTASTVTITPQQIDTTWTTETNANSRMRDLVSACAEIVNKNTDFNPPKYTDEVDCFLMNDSTMIRYVSCQGHGGFMKVLDPVGQILAKSPYTQTASSFSKSYNRHVFSGGMFVDGWTGNLTVDVVSVENDVDGNPTKIRARNVGRPDPENFGSYVWYLRPQTPCFFIHKGVTYEVDFISEWDPKNNTGVLNLNPARAGGVVSITGAIYSGFKTGSTIPVSFTAPETPGGLAAYGTAVVAGGAVSNINVTFSGSGYKTAPTFILGGALLSFTLNSSGGIAGVSIIRKGSGYTGTTNINFNTPLSGIAAQARVSSVDSNGGILTINITNNGSGYTKNSPPVYTFGTITSAGTVTVQAGFVVSEVPEQVTLITAGNRSMLANDFTQLNDLGYGIFATNGGFIENVSMFSYYCRTSYYALNGAQMRTITGSSAYGDYGLVAEGSDPNEVPIPVITKNPTSQIVTVYNTGGYINVKGGTSLYVRIKNTDYIPLSQSKIDLNHSGYVQSYNLKSATLIEDLSSTESLYSLAIDDGSGKGLYDQMPDGSRGTIRLYYDIELVGLKSSAISRPSTVLTLDEDPNQVYRMLSYTDEGNDTVLGESDTPYNYINLNVLTNSNGAYRQGIGNVSFYNRDTVNGTPVGITNTGSGYPIGPFTVTFAAPPVVTAYVDGAQGTASSPVDLIKIKTVNVGGVIHPGVVVTGTNIPTGTYIVWANTNTSSATQIRLSNSVYVADNIQLTFTGETASGKVYTNGFGNLSYLVITNHGSGYGDPTLSSVTVSGGTSNGSITPSIQGIAGANSIKVKPLGALEAARINTGLAAAEPYYYYFGYNGNLYKITGYAGPDKVQSPSALADYGEIKFVLNSDGTSGLQDEMIPGTLFAGISGGLPGGITVRISTLRATSHDMVAVGTGGYADSKIPNDLYGPPNKGPFPNQEVLQLGKGRVYFVTTDQDGNFRVGKYFGVDQGRGTVSISAPISLTNVDGISFRRGDTLVQRFSTDGSMAEESTNKVPVEQAIVTYVNKRLGIDKSSAVVGSIGPGFIARNGVLAMAGNFNMGDNRIYNLKIVGNDEKQAATKEWTDGKVSLLGTNAIDNDTSTERPGWGQMAGPLWASADPTVVIFNAYSVNLLTGNASSGYTTRISADFVTGLVKGQTLSSSDPDVDIPAGTTITSIVGNGIYDLSAACKIPYGSGSGSTIYATDPPLQTATKRYVDRRTQLATLNDVDLTSPVDLDILMFSSVARPVTTATIRPIWSATNQLINVTLNTTTIVNTPTSRSGGSDITFARSGNSLTVKLVGGAGSSNPITDYHVNNDAQIAQSKLFMTTATTATSYPTGNQRAIQAKLGLAQFDSSYFALTNGWTTFNIDNDVFPIVDGTKLLGKNTKRWDTIYGESGNFSSSFTASGAVTFGSTVSISNNTTIGGNLAVAGLFTASGATTLGSTLDVTGVTKIGGNLAVGADKFTVTALTGDVNAAGNIDGKGTLTISGKSNLAAVDIGGTLNLSGDFNLKSGANTKFSIAQATGNTVIEGTLGVTGATNLYSSLNVANNLTVATNKFTVNSATGDVVFYGDLTIGENGANKFFIDSNSGNSESKGTITATKFIGPLEGAITGSISGNAATADKVNHSLTTASNAYLYMTGTGSFDGAAAVTITTNATTASTGGTLVARDSSGNFSAGTITASLTGNATSASRVNNTLTMAVSGVGLTGSATFDGSSDKTFTVASNATTNNDAGTIVSRDATTKGFSAGKVDVEVLRLGNSTNYEFSIAAWASSNPGYVYKDAADSIFGFSASAAGRKVDVYADGDFWAMSGGVNLLKVLNSGNYNEYAPGLTGTGASGTWNISISNNAATATNATNAGTAANVAVATSSADTAYPVAFLNVGVVTKDADGTNLIYNPSTNTLTVANLSGNASTATKSSKVTINSSVSDAKDYNIPLITDITEGTLSFSGSGKPLTYNPNTGIISATVAVTNKVVQTALTSNLTAGYSVLFGSDNSVYTYSSLIFTPNNSSYISKPTLSVTDGYVIATATAARYADLAERYASDVEYAAGTVLIFGGAREVTISTNANDRRVAGVVSANPAFRMNEDLEEGIFVALTGRVPCRVVGTIKKGDLMVTSHIPGVAMANDDPKMGTVIGKALEDYDSETVGTIEVVVGRL